MAHVAVILTSEQCGHCKHMRGSGRLLSGNEIKGKKPNIPGGYFYDAAFMKKLINADTNSPKIRVINIHYKTFDTNRGVMDISIFTLDSDNKTVKQTMLKENGAKTNMALYAIGDSGKVLMNNDIDKNWNEIVNEYIPVNIGAYAFFYPSLLIFEGKTWMEGISEKKPIFGFLNGFDSKETAPYGAIPGPQPRTMEWPIFLKQFFDGSREIRGAKPEQVERVENQAEQMGNQTPEIVEREVRIVEVPEIAPSESRSLESQSGKSSGRVYSSGSKKIGFKLYVVE